MIKKEIVNLVLIVFTSLFFSCAPSFVRNKEARDDQEKYDKAVLFQSVFTEVIKVDIETEPVTTSHKTDDAADDIAIWYNAVNPEQSIIFGANKKGYIHSYNLKGKELQSINCGKINNVDIRYNTLFGNKKVAVLAGSNRTDNSIVFFIIDNKGVIHKTPDFKIDLGDVKPYGFCLYKDKKELLHAYVNSKEGYVYQYKIEFDTLGNFKSTLARTLKLKTQVEGMVADDKNHKLYVAEEEKGIFIFDANELGSTKGALIKESTSANKFISYDIEGIALLPPHYLVASIQGSFSYAIFDLNTNSYVTSFILKKGLVDGVEETDGIDILNVNLGADFPKGIFVAQDGFNYDEEEIRKQNFKIISLEEIISIIE